MKILRLGVAVCAVAVVAVVLVAWMLIARSMRLFYTALYMAVILSIVVPLILRKPSARLTHFPFPFTWGLGGGILGGKSRRS